MDEATKKRMDERQAELEKQSAEELKDLMQLSLNYLKKEFKEIAGSWNGDESGYAEERATSANDVVEAVDSLIAALKEYADGNY